MISDRLSWHELLTAAAIVSACFGWLSTAQAQQRTRSDGRPLAAAPPVEAPGWPVPLASDAAPQAPPFYPGQVPFEKGPKAPGFTAARSLLSKEVEEERRSPNPHVGPAEERLDTALVDVGGGRRLLIAYIDASSLCGIAGCDTWFWLGNANGHWRRVGEFTVADGNLQFAPTATGGMPDFIIYGHFRRFVARFDARSGAYREAPR